MFQVKIKDDATSRLPRKSSGSDLTHHPRKRSKIYWSHDRTLVLSRSVRSTRRHLHDCHRIVVKDSRDIFRGELVCGVGYQQTCLANCTITHHHTSVEVVSAVRFIVLSSVNSLDRWDNHPVLVKVKDVVLNMSNVTGILKCQRTNLQFFFL